MRNNQKLSSILTNTERASRQLPYFVEASTSTMQILQAQTLPETNRIMVNLGVITENLAELSRELQQNPAILIRGREQIGHGPGER